LSPTTQLEHDDANGEEGEGPAEKAAEGEDEEPVHKPFGPEYKKLTKERRALPIFKGKKLCFFAKFLNFLRNS